MPYTNNPKMGKVRRDAVRLVKQKGWSVRQVAKHYGYAPSTVSRWCQKDPTGGWHEIPTESSRPNKSPNALDPEIVKSIIAKRLKHRRYGQVIHQEFLREGLKVSLSSVQRTLERTNLIKKRSPWKRPHDYTERPKPAFPGALVELDTTHIRTPDGGRLYIYTAIDLYSRFAYAKAVPNIGAAPSVRFLSDLITAAPFTIKLIQTDHGSEFSTHFTHGCVRHKITHRHARVRQKNDRHISNVSIARSKKSV